MVCNITIYCCTNMTQCCLLNTRLLEDDLGNYVLVNLYCVLLYKSLFALLYRYSLLYTIRTYICRNNNCNVKAVSRIKMHMKLEI